MLWAVYNPLLHRERVMTTRILLPLIFVTGSLLAQVTYDRLLHAEHEPQNWLTYSGGYASQRYSQLTQINRDNVKNLQMKWVYHPIYEKTAKNQSKMENTPLVVDGIVYTGTALEVVALDDEDETIEIQYFDGTVTEIEFDSWNEQLLDELIDMADAPEDWSGAVDVEAEDLDREFEDNARSAWSSHQDRSLRR